MDSYENLEVYIPKKAVVKSIPLVGFPGRFLRQVGFMAPAVGGGNGDLVGTCISPVVFRRRGGRPALCRQDQLRLSSAALRRRQKTLMDFVSSNPVASRVLEDLLKTRRGHDATAGPSSPALPRGSRYHADRDAVVIYDGQVYLALTTPETSPRQRLLPRGSDTDVPASASVEMASVSSSDSQEGSSVGKMSPEPTKEQLREEEEERLLKWRCLHSKLHVKLTRIPQESGGHA